MPHFVDADTLRDLRTGGRLIPFIGAGFSIPLGLPSWSSLVDIIAEHLDYDPEVYRLNGTPLQLAEYYVATNGSIGALRSEMDRLFDPDDDAIRASRTHGLLAELRFPIIYTTNYDRIIERAFELRHVPHCTVANVDDIAKAPPNVTQIVKFHGSFNDDASLVLTESSYFERLEFESAMDIRLRADMLGKSLLFMGYGLADINVRFLLYKVHKLRQRVRRPERRVPNAYLVTFGAGDIQRTLLAQWDVAVIELDPVDKTASTIELLEALL